MPSEAPRCMTYYFLGQAVCRDAFATLLGVGWHPRLSRILEAVLAGRRSAPVDVRFLKRPHATPSVLWGQEHSYIETLYWSVAETMPSTRSGPDVDSDDELTSQDTKRYVLGEGPHALIDGDGAQLRYLPPGSILQEWRQCCATHFKCSFHLFWRVWVTDFGSRLTFRSGFMFSVCPVCVKHKLLLKRLAHDAAATVKQRALYDRHLERQYRDRQQYWEVRAHTVC